MPKWVFPLAFLFVLFLIYTEPGSAGEVASGFAEFLVELLRNTGEFLTGLFDGASGSSEGGANVPSAAESGSVDTSFTHTHDGVTHTHGG